MDVRLLLLVALVLLDARFVEPDERCLDAVVALRLLAPRRELLVLGDAVVLPRMADEARDLPRLAGAVFAKSLVSSFETRSVDCSSASGSARKRAFASESARMQSRRPRAR